MKHLTRAALAAIVAVTAFAVGSPTADVERAEAAAPVDLLVGDSVMAGMSTTSRSVLGPHVFDAKVCRRLISASCSYRGVTPINALGVIRANAGRYDRAVVVGAGYNDGGVGSAVDAIVAEARRQGIEHVVWLTYRVAGRNAGIYRSHNSVLWSKTAQYPELRIADWASLSAGRSDWVAADGLHLNGSGARAMAGLIQSTLAAIPPPPPTRCELAANGVALPASSDAVRVSAPGGIVLHDHARRLADTRSATDGKLRARTMLRIPVPADGRDGTGPVVVTVTGVEPCGPGFITAFACGTPMPVTSTLNMDRGGAIANTTIVDVGDDGALCVATSVATDLVVDLIGHVGASGDRIRPVDPLRLVDSRPDRPDALDVADGLRAERSTTVVPVRELDQVEPDDTGVVLNVAAVGARAPGFFTVFPGPCSDRPSTSNLNHTAGETIAAATITPIGDDGTVCVFHRSPSHVVVDLVGTVGEDGHVVEAVQNLRIVDTRPGDPTDDLVSIPYGDDHADRPGAFLNVVAVGAAPGYLTVRSCDENGPPTHSNLNHAADVRANLALAGTAPVCIVRRDRAHVVVDVVAWLRAG